MLIDHVIENTFSSNIFLPDKCAVIKQNKTKNMVVLQKKGGILEIVEDITEVSDGEEKVHGTGIAAIPSDAWLKRKYYALE